eukprot:TRINITY_DN6035_c0_g1_i1.p2 TRINITY_DN6035_c0_g1~~TRINITY_DN6035_c0_g1_i1.p2  ORF type:complete len:173 (+),score=33.38 TRINITY_DN6035_c0_g1_i1:558-1076(+)
MYAPQPVHVTPSTKGKGVATPPDGIIDVEDPKTWSPRVPSSAGERSCRFFKFGGILGVTLSDQRMEVLAEEAEAANTVDVASAATVRTGAGVTSTVGIVDAEEATQLALAVAASNADRQASDAVKVTVEGSASPAATASVAPVAVVSRTTTAVGTATAAGTASAAGGVGKGK